MDFNQFCKHSEDMLDYISHYFETISLRCVSFNVRPGYLKRLLPANAPYEGEPFEKIMEDFEKYIMPGLLQWRHPGFHAYFPSVSSYPSVLGALLGEVFGCVGINSITCPKGNELEAIVLDWYGKMTGLPECFLRYPEGSKGGGLLQGTVSECLLTCMITARQNFLKQTSETRFSLSKPMFVASLVVYCSKECHQSLQKCAALTLINLKILDTDENLCLRGETLSKAIKEDKEIGLIPFFVHITVETRSGACDPIEEIGPICKQHGIWLNIDASYSGNALICPEYRHYFKGIDYASSIIMSPAKWLLVHHDCCVVFTKDLNALTEYLIADRTRLETNFSDEERIFRRNKAFRVFKLWAVLRSYGVEGLQKHIRNHIQLAKLFEKCVAEDERFEVLSCDFGVVCFRLKCSDEANKTLLKAINKSGVLLLNSCIIKGKFAMRFVIGTNHADEGDVMDAWIVIQGYANRFPNIHEDIAKDEDDSDDYAIHDFT